MFKTVNQTIKALKNDIRAEIEDRHQSEHGRALVTQAIKNLRDYRAGNGPSKTLPLWATHVAFDTVTGKQSAACLFNGDYWDNNMHLDLPDRLCGIFPQSRYIFNYIYRVKKAA